jgi:hypothetical protein
MKQNDTGYTFNPSDFADVGVKLELEFQTRIVKPAPFVELAEEKLVFEYAEELAAKVELRPGARYFCVVNGSFYFGDFIEALIVNNAYQVKEMTISTLSLNENNVDSLHLLMAEEYVDRLNLIVSAFFFSHEQKNLVPYIYQELDIGDRFQLAAAGTHCKLCIFETVCGLKVVIHGSANMRSSGNIEQFVVEESPELYDFNHRYQTAILEKFKTINKPIRHQRLWQVVQKGAGAEAQAPEKERKALQKADLKAKK